MTRREEGNRNAGGDENEGVRIDPGHTSPVHSSLGEGMQQCRCYASTYMELGPVPTCARLGRPEVMGDHELLYTACVDKLVVSPTEDSIPCP